MSSYDIQTAWQFYGLFSPLTRSRGACTDGFCWHDILPDSSVLFLQACVTPRHCVIYSKRCKIDEWTFHVLRQMTLHFIRLYEVTIPRMEHLVILSHVVRLSPYLYSAIQYNLPASHKRPTKKLPQVLADSEIWEWCILRHFFIFLRGWMVWYWSKQQSKGLVIYGNVQIWWR